MKKGYVRTLEAVVGVLIVFIFVLTVLPSGQPAAERQPDEIRLLHQAMLKEIETNAAFRDDVLQEDTTMIDSYVSSTLALMGDYGFIVNIQDAGNSIVQPSGLPSDRNVYADSVVVGSNLNSYNPKLVTIYLWEATL